MIINSLTAVMEYSFQKELKHFEQQNSKDNVNAIYEHRI